MCTDILFQINFIYVTRHWKLLRQLLSRVKKVKGIADDLVKERSNY